MVIFNFNGTTNGKVFNMSGEFGVRRIICYSNNSGSSSLLNKGKIIAFFNNQKSANLTFESYYGYPKLSDFSVNLFGYGSIIVDVVPESPVNDNYFKEII